MVDHLGRAGDLGLGLGEGLAHLAVHQFGDGGLLGVDHRGVGRQGAGALGRRQRRPRRPGGLGRPDRAVDVARGRGGTSPRGRRPGAANREPLGGGDPPLAGDELAPAVAHEPSAAGPRPRPPSMRATWRIRQAGS